LVLLHWRGISKDIGRAPMSMRDHYRTKAAEFHARARNEYDGKTRLEYENLAKQYSRLAEQAERKDSAARFTSSLYSSVRR